MKRTPGQPTPADRLLERAASAANLAQALLKVLRNQGAPGVDGRSVEEVRGLGIPNVVDRWVQQALLQVLEPLWEPRFHDSNHGFRPHRGAQTAIAEATKYLSEGYAYTVDVDLSKFFDRVHHQRLLNRLAHRVKDGRVLKLVHRILQSAVVHADGTRIAPREGTPQGGPLSPWLSNVVLDELDWELAGRGLRFVRYADDCAPGNVHAR